MSDARCSPLAERPTQESMTSLQGYQAPDTEKLHGIQAGSDEPPPRECKSHVNTDRNASLTDITHQINNSDPLGFVTRQDSFDKAIRYPAVKSGTFSPDIASSKPSLVTADQVFGPVSPRRSQSYGDVHILGKSSQSNKSRSGSRVVRSNSRKYSRVRTLSTSDEAPLRSMSRFEPVTSYDSSSTRPANFSENIRTTRKPVSHRNHSNAVGVIPSAAKHGMDTQSLHAAHNKLSGFPGAYSDTNQGVFNTTTVTIQRNRFSDHSITKPERCRYLSSLSALSRGSSYYHGDYVDDNLLLSATKLDSTLIRLFSDPNPEDKSYRNQNSHASTMPYVDYAQSDLISMDAVKWRVHPMEASHKETLNAELEYIEQNIEPRNLVNKLHKEDILTLMDYNQLTRTEGQGEKAVTRLLIRTLQRRGDQAYPAFIRALSNFGFTHVSCKITSTQQAIWAGMSKDRQDYQRNIQMGFSRTGSIPALSLETHCDDSPDLHRLELRTPVEWPTSVNVPAESVHTPRVKDSNQGIAAKDSLSVRGHEFSTGSARRPSDPMDGGFKSPRHYDRVIPARDLQLHLDGVNEELRALHDDVTALKTVRSSSLGNQENGEKTDPEKKAQKSSSCTVL